MQRLSDVMSNVNLMLHRRLVPAGTTAASVSFFLKRIVYLDAERLYDNIKRETFQTHALRRESNEGVKYTVLVARALQIHAQRCRRAL